MGGPTYHSRPSGKASRSLLYIREGLSTTPDPPGGTLNHSQLPRSSVMAPDPPGGPSDLSRPSERASRSSGRAFRPFGRASRPRPVLRQVIPTTPNPTVEPPDHSRPPGRASQPLPALREGRPTLQVGFPTTPGFPGPPLPASPVLHSRPLLTTLGPLERPPDHSWSSMMATDPPGWPPDHSSHSTRTS